MLLDIIANGIDPALKPDREAIAGGIDGLDNLTELVAGESDNMKNWAEILAIQFT
jgi:hypothetical protein